VVEAGATNRAFLLRLLSHPDFASSRIDVGWVDRLVGAGEADAGPDADVALLAAAIVLHERRVAEEEMNFFASATRGRPAPPGAQRRRAVELRHRGHEYRFRIATPAPGLYRVRIDGADIEVRWERTDDHRARLAIPCGDGVMRHAIVAVPAGHDLGVEVDGRAHRIGLDPGGLVRSPAPAIVLGVHVAVGAEVRAGDRLLSLEAMKMEMPLTAPFDGRVRHVPARPGVQVAAGETLVVIEPLGGDDRTADAAPVVEFHRCARPAREVEPGRAEAVDDVRRLMLGFDMTAERVEELVGRLALPETGEADGATQAEPWGPAAAGRALGMYADMEALFSKHYSPGSSRQPGPSPDVLFHTYLREYRAEGRGLPEEFLAMLRAALGHYAVGSLADAPRLREALVRLYRSHHDLPSKNRVAIAVLRQCVEQPCWWDVLSEPGFRDLLRRLAALTQERAPDVSEAAWQARWTLFEGREMAARRAAAFDRVDAAVERLLAGPPAAERAALMAELVQTPHRLMEHLAPRLIAGGEAERALAVEIVTRRFYRGLSPDGAWSLRVDGETHLVAEHRERGESRTVLATCAGVARLRPALTGMSRTAGQLPPDAGVLADLYLGVPAGADGDLAAESAAEAVSAADLDRRIVRVCIATIRSDPPHLGYRTFVRRDGAWVEEAMLRDSHPTVGDRLELWRLRNFHVRRLEAREDVYLFSARARANERDERLLAFAEVREMRPARDAAGRLVAIPELENAVLLAFHAVQRQQARREARRRLHWNRVAVHVRPPLLARREEMLGIAERLAHASRRLGLEKVVVRVPLHEDPAQVPRDTAIDLSDPSGHRLTMTVSTPDDEPLPIMDDYALSVVRARHLGLTYVYEIVRMLAPPEPLPDFPAGSFEEYDLARPDENLLAPVSGRPHGRNTAGVVVGVVRNFTAKHPEGLVRVAILGDGTREMGALSEAECRRIAGAIDLAERLGVPVDWFPVSAGAKIAMDSGTENLDWAAAVLRRIIEFTQAGGEINVVVDAVSVGAQSYWNAEATMLMHTRGCLIMTPQGAMLLTGKRALDHAGAVSAEDNLGIGGFERIMGPNGQAQYHAHDLAEACHILLRHHEHTYAAPGERWPRPRTTSDPRDRDVTIEPLAGPEGGGALGHLWSDERNPGRRRAFDVRSVMRAVSDRDSEPLERWASLRHAESAVVWDAHLGGWSVCLIGIESKPLPREGHVPFDGPDRWSGGTLFPLSSRKVARAINAASGNRPVVVLANLSGFDGSPESLRRLQLEYGSEIGRAVVNFRGPIVFCVIARYHGGAYVVFSRSLNPSLRAVAVAGSYASVIGGSAAAAVVFPEEARALANRDPRLAALRERLRSADRPDPAAAREHDDLYAAIYAEKLREVAERFDSVHTVERALRVGSIDAIVDPVRLRPALIEAVEAGRAIAPAR
ncbi:MAG: carboxyl transferase domain-containing protein, partial [Myxococcota bacterium]|nr:carboxyl transferase domain-containing protein [Myxococcota bacterium]